MFIPYVVQPGDSLYFIARMFGCSVDAIMTANRIMNPAMIYVGQVLYIPVGQPGKPPVQPPGTFPYVVQPGDTLFFIARRFGTTVEALMQLNQIANPDLIYPGQIIYIPGAAPTTVPPTHPPTTPPPAKCGAGTFPYIVQPGDTIFLIARRFGVTEAAILAANPQIKDPNLIFPGQTICIPTMPPTTMPPTTMPPTTMPPTTMPPTTMPPMTCPSGSFAYTIRPGDTFFLLAQRFNTTVAAIQALNPNVNPNNLQIGSTICIPQVTPTTVPPVTCPVGSFAYTIRPGDTFFLLAQRFNTTVAAIQALNPNVNPNNLQIGSTICIPQVSCPAGSFAYTIQPGDTFFFLAQRFSTTVAAIQALNPTVNPNNLQIGTTICIPHATPTMPPMTCPAGSFAYTIRAGDTFFLLAQRFNTTVAAIQALNPNVNPNNLQIGSVICIPQAMPTTPPPTTCPTGSFAYIIKSGDTLFLLAQRFGTTVAAIQALNPGLDPMNLQVGRIICIPEAEGSLPPGQCPNGSFAYTIRAGDTFFLLARRFNTTVENIQALNPNVDPMNLQIGSKVCIPGAPRSQDDDQDGADEADEANEDEAKEAREDDSAPIRTRSEDREAEEKEEEIIDADALPVMARQCPAGSFAYTIQSGDTFFKLAQRFGTTVEAIQALNPGVNPNNMQIGQVICISSGTVPPTMAPTTMPPKTCPDNSFAYTIKAGDTYFILANRFGTTVASIEGLNPGVNPNNLQIGQVICIPSAPRMETEGAQSTRQCPAGSFAHVVQSGDTFFNLAQRYHTTVAAIQALNPGVNPNNLQIGQVICIPQATPTTTPPTTLPPKTCPAGSFVYTIRAGDTFFTLANRFGTTISAIEALNPGVNPNNLQIGMQICIPNVPGTTQPPTTQPPASFRYVVQVGDTLFFIARRFGTTIDAILKINPQITDPSRIFPGQVIMIPQPRSESN